ncbi:hypothetical protein [Phaeobacter sp. HF9A]|uniref:hypothetical protein n=1 Tax=Phaeobacter sp. HF9A TaxID=2721561 RepID=UPI001430B86D|nr:hypothetical protein [Phaeobacter sp. HF9A]NIZ12005.1 hypothetical protein [Phaeobacter sp. HF9A]
MDINGSGQQDQHARTLDQAPQHGKQGNTPWRQQQEQQAALAEALGRQVQAARAQAAKGTEADSEVEDLVVLAPMTGSPLLTPPAAAAQNTSAASAPAQAVEVAMHQLEAKQTGPALAVQALRFDIPLDIAGVREATLSMTATAITVTLHCPAEADRAAIMAIARDMAAQIQMRHPGKAVRVLSEQEEAEAKPEFDPLRGPVHGAKPIR